jgi:hypothetical protein
MTDLSAPEMLAGKAQDLVDTLYLPHGLTLNPADFSTAAPSSNLLRVVGALVTELSQLNSSVNHCPSPSSIQEVGTLYSHSRGGSAFTTYVQVIAAMGELQPIVRLTDPSVNYKLVLHVCSLIKVLSPPLSTCAHRQPVPCLFRPND